VRQNPDGESLHRLGSAELTGTGILDIFHSRQDDDIGIEQTIAAGTYTIEFAYREDDALLDSILFTDDLDFDAAVLEPLLYDLNGDGTTDTMLMLLS
jgi:hypothetical protein